MFMILLMQALLLTDLTASIHNILSSGFWRVFCGQSYFHLKA